MTVFTPDAKAPCGKMNIATLSVQQFTILELKLEYEFNHAYNTWLCDEYLNHAWILAVTTKMFNYLKINGMHR